MTENENPVNILLVDDQPANLLALEAVLESLGQNLVRANSGEEALRHLINRDFAVILMDVLMPGMNGFETTALIRQRERNRNTPIIFLTAGEKAEADIFQGHVAGATDYLLKPFIPEVLRFKVSGLINVRRKADEVNRLSGKLSLEAKELKTLNLAFQRESALHTRTEEALRRSEEVSRNLSADLDVRAVEREAAAKEGGR